MLILGIETSTRQVGCALAEDGLVLGAVSLAREQRHTESLVPAISFLLDSLGTRVGDIGGVAVGLGPGLFTGLRVGIATARALAQARDVPIVGVSSLDVVAHRVRSADAPVLVAMDARRGELFWARYEPPGGAAPRRRGAERVDPPAAVADAAAELGRVVIVGDGAARYPDVFAAIPGASLVGGEAALPSAAVLVELAGPRLAEGAAMPPDAVLPRYVRAPDAEAHWVERRRVVGAGATALGTGGRTIAGGSGVPGTVRPLERRP